MLLSRFEQFECALKAKGWTYDVANEVFRNRVGRLISSETLLRLIPDMSWDELDSYRDHQYEQSLKES